MGVHTDFKMRVFVLLSVFAAAATAEHVVNKTLVDDINHRTLGWTAAEPEDNIFVNVSMHTIIGLMGLRSPSDSTQSQRMEPLQVGTIPTSFDARTKWPQCKKPIRNQAKCGSCWAFAAAETLTDNLCVIGSSPPVLSPQDLVSCDKVDH